MLSSKIKERTAADVMIKDLETLSPSAKLSDALQMMVENHVTGLPIVDRAGHCVGIVSAADILAYEQEHTDEAEDGSIDDAQFFDHERGRWETVRASAFALEHFGHVSVREIMSANVVSVFSDASVSEVAQRMIEENVHRVMVVDRDQYLLGSISAIHIVRLVADGRFGC